MAAWWATAADVATVVLGVLAVVATVWVAVGQHRATGPIVTVDLAYLANWGDAAPYSGIRGSWLGPVHQGAKWQSANESTCSIEPFIRVVITNIGRMPVTVEEIGWDSGQWRDRFHESPFEIEPQRRKQVDIPLSEVLIHSYDSATKTLSPSQFHVQLSNGKLVKNRTRVRVPPPTSYRRLSSELVIRPEPTEDEES